MNNKKETSTEPAIKGLSPRAAGYFTITTATGATTNDVQTKVNSPKNVKVSLTAMGDGDGNLSSPEPQLATMREIVVTDLPQMPQVMTYQMPTPRKTSTAALKIRKSFKKL